MILSFHKNSDMIELILSMGGKKYLTQIVHRLCKTSNLQFFIVSNSHTNEIHNTYNALTKRETESTSNNQKAEYQTSFTTMCNDKFFDNLPLKSEKKACFATLCSSAALQVCKLFFYYDAVDTSESCNSYQFVSSITRSHQH